MKFQTKMTGPNILAAILGVLLGMTLASLEYQIRIKPKQVSGSDLRIVTVWQGNEIMDILVPEKMRDLIDKNSDSIDIPCDTPPDQFGIVLDQKMDSLESVTRAYYQFYSIYY